MKMTFYVYVVLLGLYASPLRAQELRLQGTMSILGEINGPFAGIGAGFENQVSTHFSLNVDVLWASQDLGTTLDFRPAVHYYFSSGQQGFYIGPSFKYIRLQEREENVDRYTENLYAPGFNFGVKSRLGEFGSLGLNLNPHITVGGSHESNVAGMSFQLGLGYSL